MEAINYFLNKMKKIACSRENGIGEYLHFSNPDNKMKIGGENR